MLDWIGADLRCAVWTGDTLQAPSHKSANFPVRLRYAAPVSHTGTCLGGLLTALALVGCARPPAAAIRPTLAVFGLEVREARLEPPQLARLEGHLQRLMEESDAFKVVPADEVKRALQRTRRQRRGDRRCHSLRCQAGLGRKRLDATRSLAVQVTKNLVGQCDVIGNVYNLDTRSVALSGRARAGCAEAEILRSLQLVACHIIGARRAGGEAGGARPVPPRDCLAHAEFLWVDDRLESWLHPPARRGRKRRDRPLSEQRMAEQLLDLRRDYDRVAGQGVPRWSVAATCRSGRLYEHFAERELATATSPPPSVRRQGEAAVSRYEKEQGVVAARRAAPFLQKARELYQKCLKLAQEHELADDRYTEQARARLKGLESAARP